MAVKKQTTYATGSPNRNANSGHPYGLNSYAQGGVVRSRPNGNYLASKNGVSNSKRPVLSPKQKRKLERARRRERDYFFVMRKSVCFLIFLFCLIVFVLSSVGLVTAYVPTLPAVIGTYTSVYRQPDYTPQDVRDQLTEEMVAAAESELEGEESEESEESVLEYVPKDFYVSGAGVLFATLASLGVMETPPDSLIPEVAFYNNTAELISAFSTESSEDTMAPIASMLYSYGGVVLLLNIVTSLLAMITSFLGIFGRRIFRGFALAGIIMIITAVVMLGIGISGLGALSKPAPVDPETPEAVETAETDEELSEDEEAEETEEAPASIIDFNNLVPFLTGGLASVPATEAEMPESQPSLVAGFGLLGLLAGGIFVFVFSLFAKKKLPYTIFDR
ncbi:MAG: hypothetical protein LBU04_02215 [Christensenellaceae bacterium]|nr:hypothetical protein [Christensenellaceae bacterium]